MTKYIDYRGNLAPFIKAIEEIDFKKNESERKHRETCLKNRRKRKLKKKNCK